MGCSQVHLLKARELSLQPGRGERHRDTGRRYGHKETKRHRVTYRDKAEYMKAHRMPQRSHSTGLVQDCLEILAPDEILKVFFIYSDSEGGFYIYSDSEGGFYFLASSDFTNLWGWLQQASKLTSTSKQN